MAILGKDVIESMMLRKVNWYGKKKVVVSSTARIIEYDNREKVALRTEARRRLSVTKRMREMNAQQVRATRKRAGEYQKFEAEKTTTAYFRPHAKERSSPKTPKSLLDDVQLGVMRVASRLIAGNVFARGA